MTRLKLSYFNQSCKEGCKEKELELEEGVNSIRINLSTGGYVEVELFERDGSKGAIAIRGYHAIVVEPHVANMIFLGLKKYGE